MDIVKAPLRHSPLAVPLADVVVVLLDGDGLVADGGDPRDVAPVAGVGLRNAPGHGRAVDLDARAARRVVPRVGVAPVDALVLVVELDAEALVDAPGDEGGAFCEGGGRLVGWSWEGWEKGGRERGLGKGVEKGDSRHL